MTMLSRVAANIFWMARYIERAENTARLINVNTNLLLDLPGRVRLGWEPIIGITGNKELFFSMYQEADERSVVRFLISNPANPGSILSALSFAREDARTIRDIIPGEAWEQVNQLYLRAKDVIRAGLSRRSRFDYLGEIIVGSQTITGLLAGTMTHDEGYEFLRIGRNLERADMTTRIVDVRSGSLLPELPEEVTLFENIQWMSVLKSLTGYQMYRRHERVGVRRSDVLRFLLLERRFPRSFYHALCEAEDSLKRLPRNDKPLNLLKRVQRKAVRAKPQSLDADGLHRLIDQLQRGLAKVNMEFTATYF